MAKRGRVPRIYVLGGTNGAGKSSIGGAAIRAAGAAYFNPDEAAALIQAANPAIALSQANGAAWNQGRRLLERAIAERLDFAIETTLGGRTMADLLERALAAAIEVRIWYIALRSAALHIARVRARVAKGGHDIPEPAIRERYDHSRLNLTRLLPKLTELRVYDNSEEANPDAGAAPEPKLLLHMAAGKIVSSCRLAATPQWAKPILAAAIKSSR